MMASQQMEAVALAIHAIFGGEKKSGYVNKEAPTTPEALQAGLSAFLAGRM